MLKAEIADKTRKSRQRYVVARWLCLSLGSVSNGRWFELLPALIKSFLLYPSLLVSLSLSLSLCLSLTVSLSPSLIMNSSSRETILNVAKFLMCAFNLSSTKLDAIS